MKKIIIYLILIFNINFNFSQKLFSNEISASIFMYHRFGENNYPSTNIKINQFKNHINELKKKKYNVLPIPEILDALINDRALPKNTIGITIDDAYLSIYEKAYPILKKNNFPFTIFVSTGSINSNSKVYMSWKQINEMINSNLPVSIGNHTVNHGHLAEKTEAEIMNEIIKSNNDYLENIGYKPNFFAYPYGEYSLKTKNIIKKNFVAAFGQHSGSLYDGIDLHELPRYALNEQYGDLKRFKFAANSQGLKLKDIIPENKLINDDNNPPLLGFTLVDNIDDIINCYPSHGIKAKLIKVGDKRLELRFDKKFPKGRTRINCTVQNKNIWQWSGFQFINH